MNQQEFESIVFPHGTERHVTDEEWETIQTVYTFHPAIPNIEGKRVIAKLYGTFGFGFIKAMLPQAQEIENNEAEIAQLKLDMTQAQDELDFKLKERRKLYETEVDALRRAYEQDCVIININAKFGAIQTQIDLRQAELRRLESREENASC